MATQEENEKAYRLAYWLHPEPTGMIALKIVLEAYEHAELRAKTQVKNQKRAGIRLQNHKEKANLQEPRSYTPYNLPTLPSNCIQVSVLEISTKWEQDQAKSPPAREPYYQPTHKDRLIRFVKWCCL